MNDLNNNLELEKENKLSLKDYYFLIRNNLLIVSIIVVVSLAAAILYAYKQVNIYQATASLKITKPQSNILTTSFSTDAGDFSSDRFIANEIEIIKSYTVRKRAAQEIISFFKNDSVSNKSKYSVIYDSERNRSHDPKGKILDADQLAGLLGNIVSVQQKRGLDFVEITTESPSPYEAALITNIYSNEYKQYNLESTRGQLTNVREFLEKQSVDKLNDLKQAEDQLSKFQEKGGIISLDAQSQNLIQQLTSLEAQRDATKIDIKSSQTELESLKAELNRQSPKVAGYLESLASEAYIKELQNNIAKLQVNRDLVQVNKNNVDNNLLNSNYNGEINRLKNILNEKIQSLKSDEPGGNPDILKDLSQKIIDAQIKIKSYQITLDELDSVLTKYEEKFNALPSTAIEYARFERQREASEKLYSLVEEKYQEALVNEQSKPGNVQIIDTARPPIYPSKPNRLLIILTGLLIGCIIALGFVFINNYFDNTIKTAEDIERRNINLLAWIPVIEGLGVNGNKNFEFIVATKPDSIPSEAFKALRTRVQFSKIGKDALKTILITSPAPSEGKTTIAINLAGTFAQSNKKTLIIDSDLRKPRIHSVFQATRSPGLIDYLFERASLEEVIRKTDLPNLYYITTGTIPPNPSEMLESIPMQEFLNDMRKKYDIVILDSAPVIAVTDSEILSRKVDATILVATAEVTEIDLMEKAVQLIKNEHSSFIGVVLNKFSYRPGYGSYYKYYYYYSQPTNGHSHLELHHKQKN
jgi:capsular exopolysaccharide synthesis family protein